MAIIIGPGNNSADARLDTSPDTPSDSTDPLVGDAGPEFAGPPSNAKGQGGDLIRESTSATFMQDVIETSMTVPVIVDFWAPWCGPCKQLGPMLEKAVRQAGGMVRLVKVNVDENQDLAAQMRVQSIPMVYAFSKGQPVDGFQGAVPESKVKEFIARLTGGAQNPVDSALEEANSLFDAGDTEGASSIFAQVLDHDSVNGPAIAGLIRCATAAGEYDHARQILAGLTPELLVNADVKAAIAGLELAEQSGGALDDTVTSELAAKLEKDPNNHQLRFDLAMSLYSAKQNEAAIEALIEIIRRDRAWNNDAAREQLLKIFEALGHTHPATVEGRRQLSSVLFS